MPNAAFKNSVVPTGLESFFVLDPALKRRAIIDRHSAAQGKMWGGLTVVPREQADDLQPFDAKQFAQALFEE